VTGEQDTDGDQGPAPPQSTEMALRELSARLQERAASLRRDIHRLRQALTDIDSAMSTSLERLERAKERSAQLEQMLANRPDPHPAAEDAAAGETGEGDTGAAIDLGAAEAEAGEADVAAAADGTTGESVAPRLYVEQRAGSDRRSGTDRRRDPAELTGLLRWLEGSSLDRRSGTDRRSGNDRRKVQAIKPTVRRKPPARPAKVRPAASVISLAEFRASRRPGPPEPPRSPGPPET